MNYEQTYRKLISGQSSGLVAYAARALLRLASIGYSLVVRLRNFSYAKGWLKAHHVDAPVICIGNITVGGTGKTPLVVWLCRQVLSDSGCVILTRGYKSTQNPKLKTQDYCDEPAMLAESCPGVGVIINPDRVAGAVEAIGKFGAAVLLMDDGFQHRRLARDLDIVVIDATLPFGYGRMLPAGLLREPATSLRRAGAVVITRCDQVSQAQLNALEEKLRTINPEMVVAKSTHTPTSAVAADGGQIDLSELTNKKMFAFCGIGNPDAFLNTVKALGCELVGSKVYGDHHSYTETCLRDVYEQARGGGADLILTTQKDWTKVICCLRSGACDFEPSVPFAYLEIEMRFLDGQDKLTALIQDALAGRIPT